MYLQNKRTILLYLGIGLLLAVSLAACAPAAEPAVSTRAPAPTFTPTAVGDAVQVDPNAVAATKEALAAEAEAPAVNNEAPAVNNEAPAVDQNTQSDGDAAPAPAATEPPAAEPTPTPAPQTAEAVINIALMNVRSGPGITYALVGGANQGESFAITGKDPTGTWWEVDFNGQKGWLFGELVTVQNTADVAVALNIPPSPVPPTPAPAPVVPTNTPVPAAPAEPAPTPVPAGPKYEFNIAVMSKCEPQAGGTWFSGKTYKNGQPQSGYRVAFSYAPDAEFVTNPIESGPHEGYRNWDAGYYSHIISAGKPRSGSWYAWVVDAGGQRISEIASFTSDGDANTCNQAVIDFDSR